MVTVGWIEVELKTRLPSARLGGGKVGRELQGNCKPTAMVPLGNLHQVPQKMSQQEEIRKPCGSL